MFASKCGASRGGLRWTVLAAGLLAVPAAPALADHGPSGSYVSVGFGGARFDSRHGAGWGERDHGRLEALRCELHRLECARAERERRQWADIERLRCEIERLSYDPCQRHRVAWLRRELHRLECQRAHDDRRDLGRIASVRCEIERLERQACAPAPRRDDRRYGHSGVSIQVSLPRVVVFR